MLATRYRLPDRREHASVRGDMVVVTEVISMGSDRSLGPLAAAWVARLEVLFDNFEKSATRSPAGAFSTGVNQITERVKHGRKLNMMIEMNDQSLRSTGGGGSTVNGFSQKHLMTLDFPAPPISPDVPKTVSCRFIRIIDPSNTVGVISHQDEY